MDIKQACASLWDAHKNDCSGFACAVAKAVGVPLAGDANAIADLVRTAPDGWQKLSGGAEAAAVARNHLVIGGLRGEQQAVPDVHGHVVVVIDGPIDRGRYPSAWWGSLRGSPGKNQTINYAWTEQDRDKVVYAAHPLP